MKIVFFIVIVTQGYSEIEPLGSFLRWYLRCKQKHLVQLKQNDRLYLT